MIRTQSTNRIAFCLAIVLVCGKSFAQPGTSTNKPQPIIIQREAVRLIDPSTFQIPLELRPARWIDIVAQVDGTVENVYVKSGESVDGQRATIRLGGKQQELVLQLAQARYRALSLELQQSKAKQEDLETKILEARLAAAQAEVDLAKFQHEKRAIHAPFTGRVYRVNVTPGQFVRAGQSMMTFGDPSKMQIEIPVDRKIVKPGNSIELRIEDKTVQASVESILPLAERFKTLRQLANSVASALVVLDNSAGQFKTGQAVYVELIPRHPVIEIPTTSLANQTNGKRKVQIVRDYVVRDIEVQLLGQVGADRVLVSGPFSKRDEMVVSTSQTLADGTQIRPLTISPRVVSGSSARNQNASTKKKESGF